MSLLDDMASILQTAGVATLGVDLFKAVLPPTPDTCVAVFEYMGAAPARAFGPTGSPAVYVQPRIQVQTRGPKDDYVVGRAKMEQAMAALGWVVNHPLGGVQYHEIAALHPIAPLRRDENSRFVFVVNFSVKASA